MTKATSMERQGDMTGKESEAEINRLLLTDAERWAISAAARIIDSYDEDMDGFPSGAASILHNLLKRTEETNGT